jgi:hypothetical protein
MKRQLATLTALALAALLVGCDDEDDKTPSPGGTTTGSASGQQAASENTTQGDGTMEWETLKDPVEGAFTIEMPKGWKNDAYIARSGVVTHNIATSLSPDGATAFFYGDPKMPHFIEPAGWVGPPPGDSLARRQAFEPAARFLPTYLKQRFGKLPGFHVVRSAQEPDLERKNQAQAQKLGVALSACTSARIDFEYTERGTIRHGAIYGSTFGMGGMIWWASIAGIVSNTDPLTHKDALFHILESQKATPEWKEKERLAAADRQRQHEQIMAQIDQNTQILSMNHQNNMATLNGMAARHQLRMDAIHAAGDASMAAYKQRDIASDNNQRGFLNYITDQNTVATPSGRTFQVDNQYERYYIHRKTKSYIGLKGDANLRDIQGIDPNDYEEAKIIR